MAEKKYQWTPEYDEYRAGSNEDGAVSDARDSAETEPGITGAAGSGPEGYSAERNSQADNSLGESFSGESFSGEIHASANSSGDADYKGSHGSGGSEDEPVRAGGLDEESSGDAHTGEEPAETGPGGDSSDADSIPENSGEAAGQGQSGASSPFDGMDPEEAAILQARIEARRRQRRRRKLRRKRLTVLGIILVFALLFTMCGREIFRLKAENYALKKQQQELKEERDRLKEELKKVDDKEYIKDQARRQLRLLNPGEIMFIFQDDEEALEEQTGEQDKK